MVVLCKLKELLEKSSGRVAVYYDPDIDGVCAGVITELAVKSVLGSKCEVFRFINSNRQHGFLLSDDEVSSLWGYTVFCVDFSMSLEKIEELTNKGLTVINLDHHSIDFDNPFWVKNSVVVNCKRNKDFEGLEYLSGAGVCFKVFEEFISSEWYDYCKSLVGLSLISDSCPYGGSTFEGFVTFMSEQAMSKGTKMNMLLKSVPHKVYRVEDNIYDRQYMEFVFNPVWNSIFRKDSDGSLGHRIIRHFMFEDSFLGFELENYLVEQKDLIRSAVSEIVENGVMFESSEFRGLVLDNLVFATTFNKKYQSYIGLVASRLMTRYNLSCIAVLLDEGVEGEVSVVRGSYRGVAALDSLKGLLPESGGHQAAFGFKGCKFSDLNVKDLNSCIANVESGGVILTTNRVVDVRSFTKFASRYEGILLENSFLGTSEQTLFRYVGGTDGVQVVRTGRLVTYRTIDGVVIRGFLEHELDKPLGLNEGVIRGCLRGGKYLDLVLNKT